MRLMKISEFRRLIYAPESAPQLATLRARIRPAEVAELARNPVLDGLV